jgi:peptide/nickel transport system permease protein
MRILALVLKRLAWSVVTVLGVVVITFAVSRIIPADPAALMAGERATTQQVQALRELHGFDRPLLVQLWRYLQQLATGDLGRSLFTTRPIIDDLMARLPATLELTLVAMLLTVALGIPIGVVSALWRNSWLDHAVRIVTVSGLAIASFWFAIILQLLFAMELGWLPLGGRIAGFPPDTITGLFLLDTAIQGNWQTHWRAWQHITLPAVTLAFPTMATIVRFTRAGVLDTINKPFVDYERAMGLPESVVIWKYVLRNALTSTITQIGLVSGVLLGGAVVIEMVFDWPGLGYYAVNSIVMSDYNAVLGVTIWISVMYILINMLVDIVHGLVDPRETAR